MHLFQKHSVTKWFRTNFNIVSTLTVWFYHAYAGSSRVLKYTEIGKITKCEKKCFLAIFRDIFQKKNAAILVHLYSTSIDSDNLTLGHKIFAIKSLGILEVF